MQMFPFFHREEKFTKAKNSMNKIIINSFMFFVTEETARVPGNFMDYQATPPSWY